VKAIRRHAENIVVNFDPDAAGSNAAERSIQMLLEEGMRVRVLELDEDLDPDEYVRKHGPEQYGTAIGRAPGYFHWLADRARKKFDMKEAEGRIQGFQFLLPAIQRIQDKLERVTIAKDVASYLGVEEGMVLEYFKKAAAARQTRSGPPPLEPLRPVEKLLLHTLLGNPEVRPPVMDRLRAIGALAEFRTARIFQAMFGLWDRQPDFGYAELEGRLEDRDKTLLTTLILADDVGDESFSLDQALACVAALETEEGERRRAALKARIKAAERGGDLAGALRLAQELREEETAGRTAKARS
jgi:DNA primase